MDATDAAKEVRKAFKEMIHASNHAAKKAMLDVEETLSRRAGVSPDDRILARIQIARLEKEIIELGPQ